VKLSQLKAVLHASPDATPRFILPDGEPIPAHFHITEVGHVAKRFIDCGGTVHDTKETCVLQTYVAGDLVHRLTAGALAKILVLGESVLAGDDLYHPAPISRELAALAPKAELVESWKTPDTLAAAVARVRDFLKSHEGVRA